MGSATPSTSTQASFRIYLLTEMGGRPVDGDPALLDQIFGRAARGDPGVGDELLETLYESAPSSSRRSISPPGRNGRSSASTTCGGGT